MRNCLPAGGSFKLVETCPAEKPPSMPKIFSAALLVLAVLLAGCNNLRFPGVYRIDIEQGNIVTTEMMEKLRPGLNEEQVRFVMGSPQSIDPFEPGRWVYLYKLRRGNGEVIENKVVLWLENGKLTRWEGKALPESLRRLLSTSQPSAPAAAGTVDAVGSGAPTAP